MRTKGFTIVELLIVIVVIAILAAITIVAFNGIQTRARDSSRESSVVALQKALELYNAENDMYPTFTGCTDNSGCAVSGLAAPLVPKYIGALPADLTGVSYARNTGGIGYGLNVPYESKPRCVAGTNPNMGWGWFTSSGLSRC
jgi:prepilin-type N-terminal cleavage/methylation domain-containing protein